MHGMTACWFCHESIEEAPVQPPAAQPPAAPHSVAQPRVPRSGTLPRRHRVSAGRVVFEGVTAAFFLTVGLLAIEAFMPKFTSTTPVVTALDERTFPELGFSITYPRGWRVEETRKVAAFRSADPARGFRVGGVGLEFDDVKKGSEKLDRARFREHEVLDTGRGKHGGAGAYKRVLSVEGLRVDQWWIERDDGTLRLEFWSRLADEEAPAIDARIVETLDLL